MKPRPETLRLSKMEQGEQRRRVFSEYVCACIHCEGRVVVIRPLATVKVLDGL